MALISLGRFLLKSFKKHSLSTGSLTNNSNAEWFADTFESVLLVPKILKLVCPKTYLIVFSIMDSIVFNSGCLSHP